MTPAERLNQLAARERERELAELKETWADLIETEEAAFQRCLKLDRENPDKTEEKAQAVRHWWRLVNSVLWMFTRTRAQYDHELQPFPMNVFVCLANVSEEFSNGIIPSLVEDARGGRGRPRRLGERKNIAYGVLYIEAVRRGEIDDKSPNKTVRRAYNVTAKTVQGWVKSRDEICIGVPFRHLSPEKLRAKMLECGDLYSRIGRGAPSEN